METKIAVSRNLQAGTSYEMQELRILSAQLAAIDKQSLADRKSAQADMLQAMMERDTLVERIEWCLTGQYGYGAMQRMRQIAAARRGNRPAQAVQLIGALEWQCPARMTADAWHKLSDADKFSLNAAVSAVLDSERDNIEAE